MSPSKAPFLAMLASMCLALFPGSAAADVRSQWESRGLFGTITEVTADHSRAVTGETDITLDTGEDQVEFTATPETRIRLTGFDSASVENLSPGQKAAVLLSDGRAISILVPAEVPVRTKHFRGIVISVGEDRTISLRSRDGQQITTLGLGDLEEIQVGELVTAVIQQDPASNGLAITDLDRATASLQRMALALESASKSKTSPNIQVLQQRLLGNSVQHLTTMREISQKTEPGIASRINNNLKDALEAYSSVSSRYGVAKPTAEVIGIVSSINSFDQQITITPQDMEEVEITITEYTGLWRIPSGLADDVLENWLRDGTDASTYVKRFGGREVRFDQLDVASRIRVWYELETTLAIRAIVLPGASLPSKSSDALLALALQREAVGVVSSVNSNSASPTVTIQDQVSGTMIDLILQPGSGVAGNTSSIELSSLPGNSVGASYDPASRLITELDRLTPGDSQGTVHGVVHSFIPKILPGNFLILTTDGELRAFNRTEDTVIRQNGRRISINEVRLGDIVRPGSNYRPASGTEHSEPGAEQELVVLSLSSPMTAPVRGTIRGISDTSNVGTIITISNQWLELISLLITHHTELRTNSDPMGNLNLAVGQRVVSGSYDPLSLEAAHLVIDKPRSVPISGEITAIDEKEASIIISHRPGASMNIFVLESTPSRITLHGNPHTRLGDLRVGQRVRIGYYDPNSHEALRLVVD